MHPSNQDLFLQKLKRSLADVPKNTRKPLSSNTLKQREAAPARLERIRQRTPQERLALLERMISEGRNLNLNIVPVSDVDAAGKAIQELAQTKTPEKGAVRQVVAWKHPMVDRLKLKKRLGENSIPVFFTEFSSQEEKVSLRGTISRAFLGVTSADFCLADSATMVMRTRPGQARSASLAPLIHVAVISLDQVLADLGELYALLKEDPAGLDQALTTCMTFITGPSKTADIEAIMVHGVHGPQEVYIYVITE